MNNTLGVSKYIMQEYKKGMLIYYSIILALFTFMAATFITVSAKPGNEISFGGFGFSAVIFMFVSGLNSFKIYFKFTQANNISRKRFYWGTTIVLIFASAIMAFVDAAFNVIFNRIIPYDGLFMDLYRNSSVIADFIWSFGLMVMAAVTGWFITILYYRCNRLMKYVISFAPVFIFIIIMIIDKLTYGVLGKILVGFLTVVLGFAGSNPYIAVFSFIVSSAVTFGLCYMLIRRAPIKD